MARRQVSIFIDGQQAGKTIRELRKEKTKIIRELNNMVEGSDKYNKKVKELDRINPTLDRHFNKLRGAKGAYDTIIAGAKNFLSIAGIAFAADTVVDYGKELFRTGVEMDTLGRKAQTVLGDALDQVTQKALDNATAMGLTTSQYIDASTAIADVLIPMGFQRDTAAEVSTELVDLSGALAEWTGGQMDAVEVTDILRKALTGEREQLKTLGIVIQEADVKARLAEKGLSDLTGQMLKQAKAAATLELITEASVDAQTSFAENSDSLVRKQAELQAQIASVSEALAIALLPLFQDLVDLAGVAANAMQWFGQTVAELSDPVLAATNAFDQQAEKVNKLETQLNPLLERYEELTTKSKLSKDEQDELKNVITRIGEVTPTAITQIDEYGNVLAISAEKSRDFLEQEKARLQFINKESIESLETQIQGLLSRREALIKTIENDADKTILGFQVYDVDQFRDDVAQLTRDITGAQAELARLSGDTPTPTNSPSPGASGDSGGSISPTEEEILAAAARRERLQKEQEKAAEREAKQLQTKLDRLKEITDNFREEQRVAALGEDEAAIERIRLKYQKEIDIAKDLERQGFEEATAQILELERIRDQEIRALRNELVKSNLEAELEAERIKEEEKALRMEEALRKRQESETLIQQELLTEQELALQELEIYYDNLIGLAERYGIDTTELAKKYNEEKARINEQYRQKETEDVLKEQQERAQAQAQAFGALATIAGGALEFLSAESTKAAGVQRVVTLAQLAFKSAEAIANATAASAGVPFPANLAAIATAVASVLANIATARRLFSEAPSVPQRKKGGYFDVRGADDGLSYRAQYIGSPQTGMLPPGAVLTSSGVLANESGQEYFVSHQDLQKPAVANYVRMIENIRQNRVVQRQEGGFAGAPVSDPATPTAPVQSPVSNEMMSILRQLTNVLQSGITATVEDDEILAILRRYRTLNEASGNTL